ncbi:MAG: multidrug ABC transporter substrate-binding protein [Firmicutes bacterium HGW-Firmicutes-15]|nr:MAG: multidrug ABC transporter substrate-binding protein [Firmicutes bacterium HGW-Firmicutes-15]
MDLFSSLKMAWQSLLANKMRSFLTMLGVIIGVGAVIAMVALSQGTASGITSRISSMGSNLLTISAGGSSGPIRGVSTSKLTNGDVEAIKNLPLVKYVASESSVNSATIAIGSNTWTTTVDGTAPELMTIKSWDTVQGAFFTASDVDSVNRVAVLGSTVVTNLFADGSSPLGQTIKINGLSFNVVGVLSTKGSSGPDDPDDIIYIPLSTAQQRLLGSTSVKSISVQATNEAALTPLKEYISTLLRQRHRLAATADDDFRIRDMAELLATIEDTTKMFTFLLGGIAGVSLLVGGIGIMNIMLVSVTERTREIGIRMAIGATTRAILTQFIIEALLLCFIGGIIGVFVGWGTSQLLSVFAGLTMKVEAWLIAVSMGFAIMIGLFFGYYPARKAANANPIDALRFE